MYKGKLGIWVSVFAVCVALYFGISYIPNIFHNMFYRENMSVSVNSTNDDYFIESINQTVISKCALSVTSNGDIVFEDAGISVNKAGYVKYSDFMYSPMVLYARAALVNNDNGFIKVVSSQNTPYRVDLLAILKGMEENKTWKELSFSTEVIKGDVCLWIPNENTSYYSEVEDLFYITLNNGKEPSAVERTQLKSRVDALLNKCIKVSDIAQEIRNEYNKPSTNYRIYIGPEFLYPRGGLEMSKRSSDSFIPIYFTKTTFLYMDVYVRNNVEGETNIADIFINKMQNNSDFMCKTGWRVKDSTYNLDNVGFIIADGVF